MIQYANGLTKVKFEKLIEHVDFLVASERFLKHCFEGCQPKLNNPAVFKALAKFAHCIGKVVYRAAPTETSANNQFGDRRDKFVALEYDLWTEVHTYGIACGLYFEETKQQVSQVGQRAVADEVEPVA